MIPSGVGPVTASAQEPSFQMGSGVGHVVICTGKEMSRNTRAVMAGLKRFLPRPPNAILAMAMAMRSPRIRIQIGRLAGTLKATSKPVITAEPSPMVHSPFSKNRWMRYSNNIQQPTEMSVSSNAGRPK